MDDLIREEDFISSRNALSFPFSHWKNSRLTHHDGARLAVGHVAEGEAVVAAAAPEAVAAALRKKKNTRKPEEIINK